MRECGKCGQGGKCGKRGGGASRRKGREFLLPALAALSALPALLLSGCPIPPPQNAIEDGATMESRLGRVVEAVGDLRAEAKSEQVTERGPVRGSIYVFLRGPDHIRFDAMSPVDTPLAVLVSDGVDFALHDVGANRYYFGAASPCTIARLVRLPLDGAAVFRVLIGLPPLVPGAPSTVSWDGGDGVYVYRQEVEDGSVVEARIAPLGDFLDTLSVRLVDNRGVVWDAVFDDRREVGGLRLPGHVRFTARDAEGPVDVWYDSIETDVGLPDDAWTYPPPYGIPSEEVGCGTEMGPVEWGTAE